jgi:hypothetical protein
MTQVGGRPMGLGRLGRRWRGWLSLALASLLTTLLILWLPAPSTARSARTPVAAVAPQPDPAGPAPMRMLDEPLTCVMGVYLQDMRDYKFDERSLFASIRLWSVCPTDQDSPLNDLSVMNSNGTSISEINTLKLPNESGYFPNSPMVFWSERTVEGTFFHHWSAKNFPFDRHTITFEFESVRSDISTFVITPDYQHSGFNPSINDGDWRASDFTLRELEHSYSTNFGKPNRKLNGKGIYSRIRVEITLSRERVTSFFKLCTGVYAAVIIASLAFLMDVREPDIVSGRTGLIVGCLFAAIVNMQQAESTLGQSEDITLTDTIHIISIVYILVSAMFALTAYLRCEAGREDFARHMDRRIHLPIFLSSFAVVNAVVIAYAAIIG